MKCWGIRPCCRNCPRLRREIDLHGTCRLLGRHLAVTRAGSYWIGFPAGSLAAEPSRDEDFSPDIRPGGHVLVLSLVFS